MKKIFFIFALVALILSFLNINNAKALESACNPIDPKPQKLETRLGTISISPDIVAVGQIMTVMIKTTEPAGNVTINIPSNLEAIDYSPKTLSDAQIKAGSWQKGAGDLAIGEYSVMLKVKVWSAKKWQQLDYSVTNTQGTGKGYDNFFAYYDKVNFSMSLDDRNQIAQTTKDVVRKVTVKGAPDIRTTLKTDKGYVGNSISQKTGSEATLNASADGTTNFFLFTQEGATINLTVSSPDTCSNSAVSQKFKINRSDVARNFSDYSWLWWVFGAVVLLFIIIMITRKKHDENSNVLINQPTRTDQNSITPEKDNTKKEETLDDLTDDKN